ncbi:MAG: bifunctional UDP-N-acetylglucosamine diphosphorylase/glucosamine-1-phosphate N-acetyltransferase GlmU [Marivivens sp.]|jgi:bifunctional UDP-N-acetylglucosamine pyrophosphorylase / glucosamine-1-phosphate N-acetyltransferase|uniref:bifunctional UDP-N-acetylglucosamine diphosphorylase/glucosamine-1-phosphate N-acetyltransferase GlmU n=1 Tax=Marivivens sp. TaxID=1978374 RepID=UPI00201F5B7A|nr:bifunctional UDP-N-acetylglucosamine diphosphorylase/glucosamine-1-phosphate N-acetyltransferase GlmU [Marivivens sp.]MCL7405512.1 bifunctional UDP-N-acetylglucosamine diphosphorylase/glucosamine-1-phosphate N-acetyltransferase GlmU [Marivivens geojensis]NBQ49544.1 bifunctional UDP-N-acetylglucosamine diphosphorylase/glucosamine-1-phosphate N-acetyltransferase GlmU [Marivivens sp.]NBT50510.1 bifunctional UDP-N-acetylglucosamine diphosphorylase/glucosamine-1-phosphate N-acetyltransferase GlmU 
MSNSLIVLAAGMGTRMNSDLPKVLHKIAGAPLVVHAMKSGEALGLDHTVVVVGHGGEAVEAAVKDWNPDAVVVTQEEQLGTGHAALQAREALAGIDGNVFVAFGDTPFIRPETLQSMLDARATHDVIVLGFEVYDPTVRYGRLVTNGDDLTGIVEFKDATEAQREIPLCNSGVICVDTQLLFSLLDEVGNDNASGEYYLPDIVGIARNRGLSATVVRCDEAETLGINTRAELARAEQLFQNAMRAEAMENGVTLHAPDTVIFAHDTVIGRDAIIEPNVVFGPRVTVESNATIRAFSHLEGCHVSRGSTVGPFARLRPGAELNEDVHIGNFVEIKNATIDEGAKVNHLTYIGDAFIGKKTNVGAGTITCNYDGVFKHKTTIGANSFIGSATMLVAPVTVGNNAMTATGTVVTKDIPDGAMAIARTKQENKAGFAVKLFEMLKAKKAKGS